MAIDIIASISHESQHAFDVDEQVNLWNAAVDNDRKKFLETFLKIEYRAWWVEYNILRRFPKHTFKKLAVSVINEVGIVRFLKEKKIENMVNGQPATYIDYFDNMFDQKRNVINLVGVHARKVSDLHDLFNLEMEISKL